jgi:uncharacterized protein
LILGSVTAVPGDRSLLDLLDEQECLRILAGEAIGRLGLSAGALPVVLPVNYVLDGRRVVFASEPGMKLDAARSGTVACLEVDGHDTLRHEGWSVLATGRLCELTGDDASAAASLPVSPWAIDGPGRHYVELGIELLSGRRIRRP